MGSLPQNARLGVTRTPWTTSTSEAASDKLTTFPAIPVIAMFLPTFLTYNLHFNKVDISKKIATIIIQSHLSYPIRHYH